MSIKTNTLTNANVYCEDKSMLGRAEEITLPEVNFTMTDHKALGMIGVRQFPNGIDKLEGKIKWNSFYDDAFKKFANPFKALRLMVRASVKIWEGGDLVDEKPYVVYLTVQTKKTPLGGFKQNDQVELENDISCTYIKVEYDGQLMMEVDVDNNIYNVAGEDLLATYRANLGI
jgi:P2 family phage contractile tail tube protein